MTLEELIVRIRVSADGSKEDLDGVLDDLRAFCDKAKNDSQDSSAAQAAAWGALSAATGVAFAKIVSAIQTGIDASNQYKAAMIGLESVASSKGIGGDAMEAEMAKVVDAFFDASSAATSYKNLLSRGYSLDQATDTIIRLKDSAAFGRQANLSLADAVKSATEGLKNENSILVDNAGVTKNVAKMWADYAKQRKISTADMTNEMKVEAEYLGIMQETTAQVGDLAKMSDTLAGSQAEAANQSTLMAQSFGEAMTPLVGLGTEAFTSMLSGITGVAGALPSITAGATSAAVAMAGLVAAVSAFKAAQTMASGIGLLSSTLKPLGAIAAVLGLVAVAYTGVKRAQEASAQAEQERIENARQTVQNEQERSKQLEQISARYKSLSQIANRTMSEEIELASLRKTLASAYGIEATAVRDSAAAHLELANAMKTEKEASYTKANSAQNIVTMAAMDKAMKASEPLLEQRLLLETKLNAASGKQIDMNQEAEISLLKQMNHAEGLNLNIGRLQETLKLLQNNDNVVTLGDLFDASPEDKKALESMLPAVDDEYIAQLEKALENIKGDLAATLPLFQDWFSEHFYQKLLQMDYAGIELPDGLGSDYLAGILNAFTIDADDTFDNADQIKDMFYNQLDVFESIAKTPKALSAIESLSAIGKKAAQGLVPTEDDITTISESWALLMGEDSPIMLGLASMEEHMGEEGAAEWMNALLASMMGLPEGFEVLGDQASTVAVRFAEFATAAKASGAVSDEVAAQYASMAKTLQGLDTTISKSKALSNNIKTAKNAIKEYKSLNKEMQRSPKAIGELNAAMKPFARTFDGSVESLAEAETAIETYAQTLQSQISQAETDLTALEGQFASLGDAAIVDGVFTADGAQMQAEIDAMRQELAELRAEAAALGIPMGSGSGGGGGGGKDSEEEAAKEAERLRKEAIQRDYDMIAHKRHMNEITLEQELTMLERIRRAHQLNAEEIMDWEEKIYDLKKEIRERDAGNVDQLGDGIIDALSARYEAMLEAETDRLDASREGWEKWRDDSVKAIEDQIAALDKLADTEDREAKDAEELRKIEKLRRSIEYEQDDYNRMKLQEQLEKAIADRADRLRKLDLQDQKEALREEIEGINSKADEQITALDKEQEAIEKSYEDRLESAALQAEAERLVMQSSQQELVDLLGEFAPEYDALGKTFGEKLVEGFQSKVGNIVSWFEDFNASLYEIQQNAASTALAGADAFYAAQSQRSAETNSATAAPTVVYQTVQFNEPVESPSKVARRIEEANEALGAMLV